MNFLLKNIRITEVVFPEVREILGCILGSPPCHSRWLPNQGYPPPPPQFEGGYNLVLIYWENYNKVQYKSVRILTPGQGGSLVYPPILDPFLEVIVYNVLRYKIIYK